MTAPSVSQRHGWLLVFGVSVLVAAGFLLTLVLPETQRRPAALPVATSTPIAPTMAAEPVAITAEAERRDITPLLLRVTDCQGQPVAVELTFLANETLVTSECPTTGVAMPAAWSHVLVRQPNWLPLCRSVAAVETDAQGRWLLRLPEPSLTARVLWPADAEPLQLYAEVDLSAEARTWPTTLREHVFRSGQAEQTTTLELPCRGDQLICGGVPTGDLTIRTRSSLVFRSDAGRSDAGLSDAGALGDRWQTKTPKRDATIELVHKPVLRVTATLLDGVLEGPLSLVVDQRNQDFTSSLRDSTHAMTLDVATAVALEGKARFVRLLLRAGKEERLVAMDTVKLTQRDQATVLQIGRGAFTITVVDGDGAPVPDACVVEQDEVLGTTDVRGEVQILVAQNGPIDAMARGFDCTQVALAELRTTRRIVLPPLSTLVIDARQAVRALGQASVAIRGGFAAPCSSRASVRLLHQWNEPGPNGSQGSGMNGGRIMLDEVSYHGSDDQVLTLVGMFEPGTPVHIRLCDRGDAVAVECTVQLVRGEVTRVELPLPMVTSWSGAVVSAQDGRSIAMAMVQFSGGFWPRQPEPVRGGRFDLCLAKDAGITISASGYMARSFAQPEANGVYRLVPARQLGLTIVDANQVAIVCRGSLWDADGHEYGADADAPGTELLWPEVPDVALTAKLHHGDEQREFAVPAGVTSCTLQWRRLR